MINGKTLYAYNKDTGQREEIKIEASSITFENSTNLETFGGIAENEDGTGGFIPIPVKTDMGRYVDSELNIRKVPYFLAADGAWRYAVTDISMCLRKDEAVNLYVKKNDTVSNAVNATTAVRATTADTAARLSNNNSLTVNLGSTVSSANLNGVNDTNTVGVTGVLAVEKGGTGKTSLNNVTVGKALSAERDGNNDTIAETYLRKPLTGIFNIVSAAWTEDTKETSEYMLYADITILGVTNKHIPFITLDRTSVGIAAIAGLLNAAETFTNTIRLRCKERPSTTISGSYCVFGG